MKTGHALIADFSGNNRCEVGAYGNDYVGDELPHNIRP